MRQKWDSRRTIRTEKQLMTFHIPPTCWCYILQSPQSLSNCALIRTNGWLPVLDCRHGGAENLNLGAFSETVHNESERKTFILSQPIHRISFAPLVSPEREIEGEGERQGKIRKWGNRSSHVRNWTICISYAYCPVIFNICSIC